MIISLTESTTGDWWRDPPNLDIVSRRQNWFQLRFVRARNFLNNKLFFQGVEESKGFNVFRRLDRDFNSNNFWDKHDKEEAKVGLTRNRATCWIQAPENNKDDTTNGTTPDGITYMILLLDPTVETGNPLWLKYRNWAKVPTVGEPVPRDSKPPNGSFFEDFIYWAKRPDAFGASESASSSSSICAPTQALLHLICAEWLTMVDYIKTRLNQVDWGIAFPSDFLEKEEQIDEHLTKLHHWRRVVPLYREMIAETFLRVFRETALPNRMRPGRNIHEPAHKFASALGPLMDTDCINAYQQDFALVLGYLEEFQSRIDRLTDVVTAVINMGDSRRGYKDNKNLRKSPHSAICLVLSKFKLINCRRMVDLARHFLHPAQFRGDTAVHDDGTRRTAWPYHPAVGNDSTTLGSDNHDCSGRLQRCQVEEGDSNVLV
jgi:hypothetical protein